MRITAAITLALVTPALAFADPPVRAETLTNARQHFAAALADLRDPVHSRRDFAAAAADFTRLIEETPSAALYVALGNAEALAGRWPRAIWAYECGRRLDPNDTALRAHLDYARSIVNDLPDGRGRAVPDSWPAWLHRPSAAEWLVLAAVAYGLACLAGGWWYLRRRGLLVAMLLFAAAFAAGTAYAFDVLDAEYDRQHPLVVIAADATPLARGNGPSYPLHPDVPHLSAGMEARVLAERGAWLQVQLSTGEIGWLRRAAVRRVE